MSDPVEPRADLVPGGPGPGSSAAVDELLWAATSAVPWAEGAGILLVVGRGDLRPWGSSCAVAQGFDER